MPAVKPRIQVSLDDDVYQTIKRYASARDQSMSSVVGELLNEAKPVLEQLSTLLEQTKQTQENAIDALLGITGHMVDSMAEQQKEFEFLRAAGSSEDCAGASESAQHSPLAINKGVNNLKSSTNNKQNIIDINNLKKKQETKDSDGHRSEK